VFKIAPDGTETTLVAFNSTNGANPWAGLVQASDGSFYGTTYAGGLWNKGTTFHLSTNGILTVLCSFDGTNGANPYAGLTLASDGNLYGTTCYGGSNNSGTVYRLTPGGALTSLYSFLLGLPEGDNPWAGLVQGTDGNLYGVNYFGGVTNCLGGVFRITTGGVLTPLVTFDGSTGGCSQSGLIQATDGSLYGSTQTKGLFRLSLAGTFTPLAPSSTNGSISPLLQAANGKFYGTTCNGGLFGKGSVFEMTPGGTLTTLVSFDGTNGASPYAGLIQGSDGALYGTTESGGLNGAGTVFQISIQGALNVLYAFHSAEGTDARLLTEASDGNFYGVTSEGGAYGFGTAFRVTPAGGFTRLADFDGSTIAYPTALAQAKDGNLYGVSFGGGSAGAGAFFRLSTGGALTPLLSFDTAVTGSLPTSLIPGSDGNLYGTSEYSTNRLGGVFRVSTNGNLNCLASLSDTESGSWLGPLLEGTNGNFYGLFPGMGNGGTFFMVPPQGGATILYAFNLNQFPPGGDPSSLLLGADGNFYGTTTSFNGALFRITHDGTLTTLYQFDASVGTSPYLLAQGPDGSFYGITYSSGPNGYGSFFRLTLEGVATVLWPLGVPGGLPAPQSLILGTDGELYGTFAAGPTFDGAVFRLLRAPLVTSLTQHPEGICLAGAWGANQPLRLWSAPAANLPLTQWNLLTSGSCDAQGAFSFIDPDQPTNRSRFYRISVP
jgi:uncharacterized repeat protein (TIGR03803 family)